MPSTRDEKSQRRSRSTGNNTRGIGGRRLSGDSSALTANSSIISGDFMSTESEKKALNVIMELMVLKNLPLRAFQKDIYQQKSPLTHLIEILRPAFVRYIPSGHLLGGKYFDGFYKRVLWDLEDKIRSHFASGYGKFVFDGWKDITKCSVVNVLLKTV